MALTRRGFMRAAGAAAGIAAVAPRFAFSSAGASEVGDGVIVLVFQRGGMDGLSMFAPADMATYRSLRPSISVRTPDEFDEPEGQAGLRLVEGGHVAPFDLSGTFYMHPRGKELFDTAWTDGNLAVIHAAGMPASESTSRSHFSSMRNWEVGSGAQDIHDGFLGRYLDQIGTTGLLSGITHGSQLGLTLAGPVPAFSMSSVPDFGVSGFKNNANIAAALHDLYDTSSTEAFTRTGATTLEAVDTVRSIDWAVPELQPGNGATYSASSFGQDLSGVASLIKADLGMRVATVDSGGWDSHRAMGSPEDPASAWGGLAEDYTANLAAFYTDLGSMMDSVTLITVSEFGRTINENASGGTDHGRGSSMMVMGNNVAGGVHGGFVDEIVDGPDGDLEVINDYRSVIAEVLSEAGGATALSDIFPTAEGLDPLGVMA